MPSEPTTSRVCGSQGIDEDGHCLRCGLPAPDPALDTETECPPGFLSPAVVRDEATCECGHSKAAHDRVVGADRRCNACRCDYYWPGERRMPYIASENIDLALRDELREWQTASAHTFLRFEDALPENTPAVVRDETPMCRRCGKPLRLVTNPPGSWMNDDQFDSVKRGDWYCEPCGDPIDKDGRSYFRESQVRPASPVSVPEERQEEEDEWCVPMPTSDDLRMMSFAFGDNRRISLRRLAIALDALAAAVKGCNAELPDGTLCGEYDATQIALCAGCRRRRDMAIHGLLDGRTTT